MKNILFRSDSSSTIGTGHVMRDLVLADQFKDANILFATQNLRGNINHKIEEKNYKIEILKSNDIEEVVALIDKYSIDMIIIDNYDIDYIYEKELNEETYVKIFVLDDTYKKHYCDILLNHNVYAIETKYKGLVPKHCELRCGPRFTLLREEFREEKQNNRNLSTKNYSKKVLIVMGGADHANINIKILKVLKNFPIMQAIVVTTIANQHLSELKDYVKGKKNVTLHIDTNQIAMLMSQADFAIVTPSVTINEVFYMGLPFIAIKTAKNQNEMYEYLVKNNNLALTTFEINTLEQNIKSILEKL